MDLIITCTKTDISWTIHVWTSLADYIHLQIKAGALLPLNKNFLVAILAWHTIAILAWQTIMFSNLVKAIVH